MGIPIKHRSYEQDPQGTHSFSAIVVGGGPAGIAALGNLLESTESGSIAWVDPDFGGGRIPQAYEEVPSNTRAALFVMFAKAYAPFLEIIKNTPIPNALTVIEDLPQDKPCSLLYAGQLLKMLSSGLSKNSRVECFHGRVTEAAWSEETSAWLLYFQASNRIYFETLSAGMVVYCTGSSPTTAPLPYCLDVNPTPLDLDLALKPSALCRVFPSDVDITVAVIGASHSAILVLMNLVQLARASHPLLKVCWFTRSPALKYAIYQDERIFYDNTGLKGKAADFAKTYLDGDRLQIGPVSDIVRRVDCSGGMAKETSILRHELPQCEYFIQAIGYTPNELPSMVARPRFDNITGRFVDGNSGKRLHGLFGAGIAFPERVIDISGNVEYAVGFFKFISFLKRVIPHWISETGLDLKKPTE